MDQYINILQSNSNASYVRTIVLKALSDPNVYAGFAELSDLVAPILGDSTNGKAMLKTLDLFSYGTYQEYISASEGTYINLTAAQLLKLRSLTVVTVVQQRCDAEETRGKSSSVLPISTGSGSSRRNRRLRKSSVDQKDKQQNSCNIIPYSVLELELGISKPGDSSEPSIRPLEDLLIHCIYSDLLPSGTKLDHRNMSLVIKLSSNFTAETGTAKVESNNILCRDVNVKSDVPDMISKLEAFYGRGKDRIEILDASLEKMNKNAMNNAEKSKAMEVSIEETKEKLGNTINPRVSNSTLRMMSGGSALSHGRGRQVKRSRAGLA